MGPGTSGSLRCYSGQLPCSLAQRTYKFPPAPCVSMPSQIFWRLCSWLGLPSWKMAGQIMDKNRNPRMKHMLPIWTLAGLTGTEPLCVGHCFLIDGIYGGDAIMISGETPASINTQTFIFSLSLSLCHPHTHTPTHSHPQILVS